MLLMRFISKKVGCMADGALLEVETFEILKIGVNFGLDQGNYRPNGKRKTASTEGTLFG